MTTALLVEQVNVTPRKATAWLRTNTSNRRLREHRVEMYANQMTRGQWLATGDPIRFDKNGVLLDGQHRLAAIVQTGQAVRMVVVYGLEPEAYQVLDIGMGRTAGDALGIGVASAKAKAACARILYVVDTGGDPRYPTELSAVTRIDIAEYYTANAADMDAALVAAQRLYFALPNSNQTAWMAFVVLANRVNPEWTTEFITAIQTGANLEPGDPRLSLRNWLSNARLGVRAKAGASVHLGIYIKAWNAWLANQKRTLSILRDDETYPVPADHRVTGRKP